MCFYVPRDSDLLVVGLRVHILRPSLINEGPGEDTSEGHRNCGSPKQTLTG